MALKSEYKGYFFALLGALALANVYVFSKAALNEVKLAQFGTYWFGFGFIWNLIYVISFGKQKSLIGISRKNVVAIIIIGFIELIATTIFFVTIKIIIHPAVVSFIANLNPFFVVLLGISILKERFNLIELSGMMLTLFGSLVISYQPHHEISDFFIKGSELVVISSFLYALSIIIAKRTLRKVDPSILSITRVGFRRHTCLISARHLVCTPG